MIIETLIIASMIHSTPWGVTGPLWTQINVHTHEAVQPATQNALEIQRLWCYDEAGCEEYFGQSCTRKVCDGVAICFITQPGHYVTPLPDGVLYIEGILPDYRTFNATWGGPADWNVSGETNNQDFFDFLTAFFAGEADFNLDAITNSVDLFEYLEFFFGE